MGKRRKIQVCGGSAMRAESPGRMEFGCEGDTYVSHQAEGIASTWPPSGGVCAIASCLP